LDNLTHSLAGAALAKAGLERRTPLATATLVLAANVPDVDMLAYANGAYYALAVRRGLTHGVPAMLVLPFVVAGAILAWDRWIRLRRRPEALPARPRAVLALAFIGLLTHPLLDWMNNYGMRWWLPFDGRWSYGDALFIIDPWLWLSLGTAVYLGRSWSRRWQVVWATGAIGGSVLVAAPPTVPAAAEIVWFLTLVLVSNANVRGFPATERGRQRLAAALCIGSVLYGLEMLASSRAARQDVIDAATRAGYPSAQDVMVAPVEADPLGGEVVLLTGDSYVRGAHHWLDAPRTRFDTLLTQPFQDLPPGTESIAQEILDAARAEPDVQRYLTWARYPYFRVTPDGDGFRVRVSDVRYDRRPTGALGGLEVRVGAQR
jgi:inner membrane protein